MPLEKLRILSLLVIGASITAYLSGDFGLVFFLIQTLSTLPLWFQIDLEKIRVNPFWKMYGYITFGLFIISIILRIRMKTSIFFLVWFCLVYEFYGEKRPRAPVRIVSLLSFLIVIHQARIDSGLNLFLGVIIYLVCVVFCLMGFHTDLRVKFNFFALARQQLPRVLMHALAIFPLGLLLFWMLPRFPNQSLSSLPSLIGNRISGFSGRVSLTDIGTLKLSRKHVMDLKPLDGKLHSRYLKGRVLNFYQKGVWSSTFFSSTVRPPEAPNQYVFKRRMRGERLEYRVDLEALHGNTLFFFDNLLEIRGRFGQLKKSDNLDHISFNGGFPTAISYVFAASTEPTGLDGDSVQHYLHMPHRLRYFKEEGDRLLGPFPNLDTEDKVRVFMDYFEREFTYTLKINNFGVKDPLREFMINRREGHCELFASSMVMLLRAQKIPARLVTGFVVPKVHALGNFYHITESDAHAWVEFFHEGSWRTLDPTPPSDPIAPHFAETQLAYLKRFWRTMILTWDFDAQKEHLLKARQTLGALFSWTFANPRIWLWPLLLILFSAYFIKIRPNRLRPRNRLIAVFKKIEALLQKTYRPRRPNEGYYEYVGKIGLDAPLELSVLSFLRSYHRLRFGNSSVQDDQLTDVFSRAKKIIKSLQGH